MWLIGCRDEFVYLRERKKIRMLNITKWEQLQNSYSSWNIITVKKLQNFGRRTWSVRAETTWEYQALLQTVLTLILLTWRIWWAPNCASKGQMGFNSAFNLLAPELFFLILAHPVYKMWIIQEPNVRIMKQTAFWREKKRTVHTMFKIFGTYICWINI